MKLNKKSIIIILSILLIGCSNTPTEENSLTSLQAMGELKVGIYPHFEPMVYINENGEYTGHDIELIERIAQEIGVKTIYKEMLFPDLFGATQSKEVDVMISSITITAERSQYTLFSVPYFDGGQIIIVNTNNNDIKSINNLGGKKVGVLAGSTGEEAALLYANESEIILYENRNVDDLANNKIDAYIEDYIFATNYVNKNPQFKIIGEPITQEYYGIGTSIGNKALMDEINKIIREMKRSGELYKIKDKWIK